MKSLEINGRKWTASYGGTGHSSGGSGAPPQITKHRIVFEAGGDSRSDWTRTKDVEGLSDEEIRQAFRRATEAVKQEWRVVFDAANERPMEMLALTGEGIAVQETPSQSLLKAIVDRWGPFNPAGHHPVAGSHGYVDVQWIEGDRSLAHVRSGGGPPPRD